MRGNGRLGWDRGGGGTPFDADALNLVVPYAEVYFPAAVWTGALTQPAIYHEDFSMDQAATADDTENAWEFVTGANRDIYTNWQFRNAPIDYTDPQFRLLPKMIQIADAAAPSPQEFAYFEFAIGVNYNGTTTDWTTETPQERQLQCGIPARRVNFACGAGGDNAALFDTIGGDGSLDLAEANYLRLEWERFGTSGNDTYGGSVYFLGASLQFKTDFNNVAVYPS